MMIEKSGSIRLRDIPVAGSLPPEQQALAMQAAERLRSLRQAAALMALPELFAQLWDELKPEFVLSQQENGTIESQKELARPMSKSCAAWHSSIAKRSRLRWRNGCKTLRICAQAAARSLPLPYRPMMHCRL